MNAFTSRRGAALALVALASAATRVAAQSPPLLRELHRLLPIDIARPLLGDLDGDGDLDLLGTDLAAPILNDGDGRFSGAVPANAFLPPNTSDMLLVDVDQDLDLDLIETRAGNYMPSECFGFPQRLYLNDGAGHFIDASTSFPSHGNAADVAAGDLDGDGDMDLVVGEYTNDYCDGPDAPGYDEVFVNDGTGSFQVLPTLLSPELANTQQLALGDVDGDGDLDVLIADLSGAELWRNDGLPVFSDVSSQLPAMTTLRGCVLGDIDGDGDPDAVVWNTVGGWLWFNGGSGNFAVGASLASLASAGDAKLIDLDLDGDLDLVHGGPAGDRVHLNDGAGAFTDATTTHLPGPAASTWRRAFGDVDGDGDIDGLFATGIGRDALRLNDGSGRLWLAPEPRVEGRTDMRGPWRVGDIDGDGDTDLVSAVASGATGSLDILLNDGRGAFATSSAGAQPTFSGWPRTLALADFDGDADLDVFVANWLGSNGIAGRDALLLNTGGGLFMDGSQQLPAFDDTTDDVAVGDVDGDLDLDLLLANYVVNMPAPVRLYINDGQGHFANAHSQAPAMSGARTVQMGDVDGDGDLDAYLGALFVHAVFLNDGAGDFTQSPAALPALGEWPISSASGDVDGDSDLDLVLANRLRLLVNDGSGVFTDATSSLGGLLPFSWAERVQLVDLDQDGDPDLLASQGASSVVRFNDGAGHFSDASAWVEPEHEPLLVLDFDGDRDLDALDWTGHLLTNTLRQVAWRQIPRPGRRLDLDVYGPPNGHYLLLAARDPMSAVQTPFGSFGLLRPTIFRIDHGPLDAGGRASVRVDVPDNPALVGRDYFWQALVGRPARLGNVERVVFSGL